MYMKAIIQSFIIVAMATAITACTAEESLAPQADQPITVSATMPGEVWATASRASSMGTLDKTDYSEVELHYTDYKGVAATYEVPLNTIEFSVANSEYSFFFTTGSDLVWERVDATKPIHLTCKEGEVTFHTSVESAEPGKALTFKEAMKPTMAKLTVKLTFNHNITGELQTLNATIKAAGAATDYHPQTDGGIHKADETAAVQSLALEATGSDNVFTSSMLLPEQTMDNTLTVTYGSEITWTLDLSQVKVKDTNPVQYANQLIAGQHLTLNLKASITSLNAPADVQIEAFTKADADDYTGELGGVAKTYTYDAGTNTYTIWHENAIEACLADRAKNHPDAAVVSGIPTYAVVSGAETDRNAINKAIADGKTTFIIMGELTDDLCSYITQSGAASGTINLFLAEATSIGRNAFRECSALNSVNSPKVTSIGSNAFELCSVLKSVNSPKVTSIGESAFGECSALTSVNFPEATSIGIGAFGACRTLASVNLPKATWIDNGVFSQCYALTDLNLPAATSIGLQAFMHCENLKSLTLGSVIGEVGHQAFMNASTASCDLTLASGQKQSTDYPATEGSNSWAGYTWKSITIK